METNGGPGTTVATRPARAPLPPEIQAKIDANRARNIMVAQIRGTHWGKDSSEAVIRAVAEYAHRHGIDAVMEVEILGGRLYKNANYYERRGAELIAAGVISRIEINQVGDDGRLLALVATAEQWAKEEAAAGDEDEARRWREQAKKLRREHMRRAEERVRVNAPEGAAAVVIVRIYTPWLVEPVEGANWAGGGIRPLTKYGNPGDPIGDAEPAKTAETRALRRAWKKLAEAGKKIEGAEAVQAFVRSESAISEEGVELTQVIEAEQAQITSGHEAARPKMLAGTGADPYDVPAREPAPVAASTPVDDDRTPAASVPKAAESGAAPAPAAEPSSSRTIGFPEKMPNQLRHLTGRAYMYCGTDDLVQARDYLRLHPGPTSTQRVNDIEDVLEDRRLRNDPGPPSGPTGRVPRAMGDLPDDLAADHARAAKPAADDAQSDIPL